MGKDIRLGSLEKAFGQTWKNHALERDGGRRVARAVQADDRIALHKRQVSDLQRRGEYLRDQNRKARRAQWLFDKEQARLRQQEAALGDLLKQTYRNPVIARKRLDLFAELGKLREVNRPKKERWKVWMDALLGRGAPKIGTLRGLAVFAMKSRKRQQAERAQQRQVLRQYEKVAAAQRRLESRRMEAAIARGRLFHAREDYERVKSLVGPSRERKEARRQLYRDRDHAVAALRPEDLRNPGLAPEQRERLQILHERQNQRPDKGQRWADFRQRLNEAREKDRQRPSRDRGGRERDDFDRER